LNWVTRTSVALKSRTTCPEPRRGSRCLSFLLTHAHMSSLRESEDTVNFDSPGPKTRGFPAAPEACSAPGSTPSDPSKICLRQWGFRNSSATARHFPKSAEVLGCNRARGADSGALSWTWVRAPQSQLKSSHQNPFPACGKAIVRSYHTGQPAPIWRLLGAFFSPEPPQALDFTGFSCLIHNLFRLVWDI